MLDNGGKERLLMIRFEQAKKLLRAINELKPADVSQESWNARLSALFWDGNQLKWPEFSEPFNGR